MDTLEGQNTDRMHVIKRVHLMIICIYSIGLFISIFVASMTLSTDVSRKYTLLSIVLPILIVAHVYARIAWAKSVSLAKSVSVILGVILLFGFPLGTIFGIIIIFKVIKYSDTENLIRRETAGITKPSN